MTSSNSPPVEESPKGRKRAARLRVPGEAENGEGPLKMDIDGISDLSARSHRRSNRIKIRPLSHESHRAQGPIKLTTKSSDKDIKKYYLDKRVKKQVMNLETIFEEPTIENETMSKRKYKRSLNFSVSLSKNSAKVKKRKLKVETLSGQKRKMKKVALKCLLEKLSDLDEVEA